MGMFDFLKPKKEKATGNEVFLKDVGKAQIGASQMFERAHQAMLREASADHTGKFRGRLAGDTWQQLGPGLDAQQIAAGDMRRHGQYENLAATGLGAALREGTQRGTELKDEITHAGATSRLSNAKASGQDLATAARQESAVASNRTQLANEWKENVAGGALTLAAIGADRYMQRKRQMPGVPSAQDPQYSPTLASPVNQMALLSGRPQNINYSPVTYNNPLAASRQI